MNKSPPPEATGRRKRVQTKPVASDGAKSSFQNHTGPKAQAALRLWGLFEAGDCQFIPNDLYCLDFYKMEEWKTLVRWIPKQRASAGGKLGE